MRIYRDEDADLGLLLGKQIAVIGYGNQGRSQALNLRDSGLNVIIGNRSDSYAQKAREDGFSPITIPQAVEQGEVVMLLLPDEIIPIVFQREIETYLRDGSTLVFASGFNVALGFISLPKTVDVVLLAPRMIGAGVRDLYLSGGGFPSFVGIAQDTTGSAFSLALALAKGIGSTRAGVVEVTFAQEAELDLFTEQCFGPAFGQVLVTAVDLLVEQGYPPEAVLLELYMSGEFAYTLSKIAELGMVEQSRLHSLTSQYGSLSRGVRFLQPDLRQKMLQGLDEIRNGDFAQEWFAEHRAGYPTLNSLREAATSLPLFQWETELRSKLGILSQTSQYFTKCDSTHAGVSERRQNRLKSWLSRWKKRGAKASAPLDPLTAEQISQVLKVFLGSLEGSREIQQFAQDRQLIVEYVLPDLDQECYMSFQGGLVSGSLGKAPQAADITLEMHSQTMDGMFTGRINAMRTAMSGGIKFSGDARQAMTIQRVQDDLIKLYLRARRNFQ